MVCTAHATFRHHPADFKTVLTLQVAFPKYCRPPHIFSACVLMELKTSDQNRRAGLRGCGRAAFAHLARAVGCHPIFVLSGKMKGGCKDGSLHQPQTLQMINASRAWQNDSLSTGYPSIYPSIYLCESVSLSTFSPVYLPAHRCLYVCVYMCMYAHMYIYIYIYIHM